MPFADVLLLDVGGKVMEFVLCGQWSPICKCVKQATVIDPYSNWNSSP